MSIDARGFYEKEPAWGSHRKALADELNINTANWLLSKGVTVARELFPYEADRAVICAFLAGKLTKHGQFSDRILTSPPGKLSIDGTIVAWFDTAGALTVSLTGAFPHSTARVIEHMAQTLGIDDMQITYERKRAPEDELRWYAGDRQITLAEPFVLAGPMSVAAYRASLRSEGPGE